MSERRRARSPLQRWTTPAGRILCCVVLVVATATLPLGHDVALATAAAVAVGVLVLARPRWSMLWRRALLALAVVGALLLPLAISGAADATGVAVRAGIVVVLVLGFAATLQLEEVGGALRGVGLPAGLCTVVETMLRQLGVVRDEGRRLSLARQLRGARGAFLSTETIAALLLRTIDRAERVELAMHLRGAGDGVRRRNARLRWRDAPAALTSLAAAGAVHASAQLW